MDFRALEKKPSPASRLAGRFVARAAREAGANRRICAEVNRAARYAYEWLASSPDNNKNQKEMYIDAVCDDRTPRRDHQIATTIVDDPKFNANCQIMDYEGRKTTPAKLASNLLYDQGGREVLEALHRRGSKDAGRIIQENLAA